MNIISVIQQNLKDAIPLLTELKGKGALSFAQKRELWRICQECSYTNDFIAEAEVVAHEDATLLLTAAQQILSDSNTCLEILADIPPTCFPAVIQEEITAHLKPLRDPYEAEKEKAHPLWMEYQRMSKRLDFMSYDDPEFAQLDKECEAKKAEYEACHARVNELFAAYDKERREVAGLEFFNLELFIIVLQKLSAISKSIIIDLDNARKEGRL